jgi:acetyl esterase
VEPTAEAQAAFVAKVDHDMQGTVWTAGGCASWYLDRQGRNSTLWPGFTFAFRQRVAPFDPGEYRTVMPHAKGNGVKEGIATRLAFKAARGLLHLPAGVQRRLAGGGHVKRDGLELDPAMQLLLAIDAKIAGDWPNDALRLRKERDKAALDFRGPLPYVPGVRDLEVDGAAGPLRARHYRPYEKDAPLLVYFHGGGFVFGNLETHDPGCRLLCQHGKMNVLAVEYRLVPEHRFPDAIHDGQAAFAWAVKHAKELGADPSRVGVGGDSAGANLSAVLCLLAKDKEPRPVCQVLFYPPTDRSRPHASMNSLADGFMLTRDTIAWFHGQYATMAGAEATDPRISPLLATDLRGLPPAVVVTAGFDPLRDEGLAYADALEKAGVRVVRKQYDGLIHGFFNLTGLHDGSRDAVCEVGRLVKGVMGAEGVRVGSDAVRERRESV